MRFILLFLLGTAVQALARWVCSFTDGYGDKVIPFRQQNGKLALTLSVNDFIEFTTYEFVKE